MDSIAILDFGSQYSQLIARRVRESNVYCELFPWHTDAKKVLSIKPKGFILSGGPASVYDAGAPQIPVFILKSGLPILGICYGMQMLVHALGGRVIPTSDREYGTASLTTSSPNPLIPTGKELVWMSHGDRIDTPPNGFITIARTDNSPIAVIGDIERKYYGLQFHPEVHHTHNGIAILRRFVVDISGAKPEWTPEAIINEAVENIRRKVGTSQILSAVSGGVDSSVATALVHKALRDQLEAVFVRNGLLREGEDENVIDTFQHHFGVKLHVVNAIEEFMLALSGISNPEEKRRIIGERFIRIFEEQARIIEMPAYLVQGTIYPDVVESSAPDRAQAQRIKTHHNVGGLPQNMQFELVEPLRYLFKDEVREVGNALGLPAELVWRQPFPGPGLAVRCLGEVTFERIQRLRAADAILTEELATAGLLQMRTEGNTISGSAQAFAVLLPVRSVGVMGDKRTYQETIVIRAVTTEDFMTADWARLPYDLLSLIATRIVNEVPGVNRIVYDITSKPPATIEWE